MADSLDTSYFETLTTKGPTEQNAGDPYYSKIAKSGPPPGTDLTTATTSYFETLASSTGAIPYVPSDIDKPKVYSELDPALNDYYVKNGKTYLKHSQYGGVLVDSNKNIVLDEKGEVKEVDPDHLTYGTTEGPSSPTPNESRILLGKDRTGAEAGSSYSIKKGLDSLSPILKKQRDGTALNIAKVNGGIGSATSGERVSSDEMASPYGHSTTRNGQRPVDSDWVCNAFLVPTMDITDLDDQYNRYWSSASLKYYDTTMGGNIACNARPQANWYADIRDPGRLNRNEASVTDYRGNFGLGIHYSEAIDDPAQKVFFTFGVPQYNSISNFVRRAFDSDQIILTKTGREKSIWYTAAKMITQAMWLTQAPIFAATWYFMQAVSGFFPGPQSKYYTVKEDMFHYWSIVDNLVNQIALNSGLVVRLPFEEDSSTKGQRPGRPYQMDSSHYDALHKHIPDIVTKISAGGAEITRIDVYAMASKAQRMYNKMFLLDYKNANDPTLSGDYKGYVKKNNASHSTYISSANSKPSLFARLASLVTSSYYSIEASEGNMNKAEMHPSLSAGGLQDEISTSKTDLNTEDPKLVTITDDKKTPPKPPTPPASGGTKPGPTGDKDPSEEDISSMEIKESAQSSLPEEKTMDGHSTDASWWDKIKGELSALYNDGTKFAVFAVDHTGSVSSSFSNSYGESDLSNKLNSTSSQIREARFSFADGNLLEGAGKIVQSVVGAAANAASGALDGLTFGFSNILKGLSGNGYLDIPKHWMSSQAQLPRMTYNMTLISPYGNTMSRLQNIYVPLCMILAGALPRATGKSSYGAPYLCQVFDVGRFQTKLGAIESVSITVGTSNLPFNLSGKPLAIDVSITVVDLSSIMYMPVSAGGPLSNINIAMDEDNTLVDYLAVLAGQDIYSQMYPFPKARLNLAKTLSSWSAVTSEAFQAAMIHDKSLNGGGLYYVARPFAKVIEAISKGTAATQTIDNR